MWDIRKVKWSLYNVKCFLSSPSSLAKSRDLNYPANLFHNCRVINQVGGWLLPEGVRGSLQEGLLELRGVGNILLLCYA